MQFPQKISFKDKGPKGGKIQGTMVGDDMPTSIQIKGTNDVTNVSREREKERGREGAELTERQERDRHRESCRGEHNERHKHRVHAGYDNDDDEDNDDNFNNCYGKWESRGRYQTLKQTLILIKKGVPLLEVSYDVNGNYINETPTCNITNSSISLLENEVTIAWTATKEVKVAQYNSEFKLPGATDWEIFHIDRPLGDGTNYATIDTPTVSGSINYQLKVVFTDTTEKILLTQAIVVAPPAPIDECSVDYFNVTANPDGGETVRLEWLTSIEKNVANFVYERQIPGSSGYTPVENTIAAESAGTIYFTNDGTSGIVGDIFYKLIAVYNDGNTKVLGLQTVTL